MYKTQRVINGTLIIVWIVFLVLKLVGVIKFSWILVWLPLILVPVLCVFWTVWFACKEFKKMERFEYYEQNNY